MGKWQCRHEDGYRDLGGGFVTANMYLHRIPFSSNTWGLKGPGFGLWWATLATSVLPYLTQGGDQRTPLGFTIFWCWGSMEAHTLFLSCPFAEDIWRIVFLTYYITPPTNIKNMFGKWLNSIDKMTKARIRIGVSTLCLIDLKM
jgi:hypothetical protein